MALAMTAREICVAFAKPLQSSHDQKQNFYTHKKNSSTTRVSTQPKKKELFWQQPHTESDFIQQVSNCLLVFYKAFKECHWRVRYLTRLGSGLYGGGGLQWEADTIVWLLWPPFMSPLACMWWLLSMLGPARDGCVISKTIKSKMALDCYRLPRHVSIWQQRGLIAVSYHLT